MQIIRGDTAAAAWIAATCLALVAGCVWPVEVNEREEEGFPPVLDWKLVSPSPDEVVRLIPEASVTFSIEGAVSDQDTAPENLQVFWYLDFPQGCDKEVCKGSFKEGGIADRSILNVNNCTSDFKFHASYYSGTNQNYLHQLELIVTDGKVVHDNLNGRTIQGGFAYASWWLLEPNKCTQ